MPWVKSGPVDWVNQDYPGYVIVQDQLWEYSYRHDADQARPKQDLSDHRVRKV